MSIYQEDDALIHGQDPEYRGIHEWWEERFPGRVFQNDWNKSASTEVDHGDAFTRRITLSAEIGPQPIVVVTHSFDGYSVDKIEEE